MSSHISPTKSFVEMKSFAILAPQQYFCYWEKSYACEGIRKGGEMNKGNIKRSMENKIQTPDKLLDAERKEA